MSESEEDRIRVLERQVALNVQKMEQLEKSINNLSSGINRGLWIIGGGFLAAAVSWVINGGFSSGH